MRTKRLLYPVLSSLTLILSSACGGNKTPDGNEALSFDSLKMDTVVFLTEDTDSMAPKCEIHLNLAYAKGLHSDRINDSIISSGIFIKDYLPKDCSGMSFTALTDSFVATYINRYKADCGDLAANDAPAPLLSYYYGVKSRAQAVSDTLVNYEASVYAFSGGANGQSITIARNFNPQTGAPVVLGDVLKGDFQSGISDLIVKNLQKKFGAADLKALQEKGVFFMIDPYVPDNYLLQPDSVVFIYSQNEMAPHALGEIRTAVSWEVLKPWR